MALLNPSLLLGILWQMRLRPPGYLADCLWKPWEWTIKLKQLTSPVAIASAVRTAQISAPFWRQIGLRSSTEMLHVTRKKIVPSYTTYTKNVSKTYKKGIPITQCYKCQWCYDPTAISAMWKTNFWILVKQCNRRCKYEKCETVCTKHRIFVLWK